MSVVCVSIKQKRMSSHRVQREQSTEMSRDNMAVWRDCIRTWYPDYETKTYFVPPVVITRIPFDVVTVAGQSVLVPQSNPDQGRAVQPSSKQVKVQRVQDSDTRDDLALQKVLLSLRELVSDHSEPMFVISQLQFSGYLGEPCYAAAAKQFARPQNLSKDHRRGDFDILVIHRHYGIITGEIKSVLSNQHLVLSQQDVDHVVTDRVRNVDHVVTDRVRNAIKQLNISEVVLRDITKDLEPNLAIRKLLILPYVTADILIRVISSDEHLKQDLVTCLHAVDFEQALHCCLLADNLSSSGIETANGQQPQAWWSTFGASINDSNMTESLYLDLLARFCGPATTVSVYCPTSPRIGIRTEGEGVAVTGERMTSLVLTPEQISLLTRAPPKVWLTGPPGVGKSVMLVLMALTWLRQGHNVHLFSVRSASLAVTRMINHLIKMSMCNDPNTPSVVGSVHLHEYDFHNKETDVDKAINMLIATKGNGGPYVIFDEFLPADRHIARYLRFVTELCTCLPNVSLWAASPYYQQRPRELQEERMCIPLRCPPAVLSEVQKGVNVFSTAVYPYTTTTLATPCDGPNIIRLSHSGLEHAGRWPLECVKCGQSIAGILQRLGVGVTGTDANGRISTADDSYTNNPNVCKITPFPPLQYRDVFVLTRRADLPDDVMHHGVVRGLCDAGIPVRVIREKHKSTDMCDTAVRQSNVVTVADYGIVSGLERKVVVWLPGRIPDFDTDKTDDLIDRADKLFAMSRCTAQLVVVDVPKENRHAAVQTTKRQRQCCVS